MWFESWDSIINIVVTGAVCFAGLVILLRISGKRTLAKMNAFDFVLTITIGSALATTITSKDTSIADGMAALAILIFMQFIIAWLEVRSENFQQLIKSTPSVLFYEDDYQTRTMRKERMTKVEVLAAMRFHGYSDPSQVHLVLLETDGRLSVIPKSQREEREYGTLEPVQSFKPGEVP